MKYIIITITTLTCFTSHTMDTQEQLKKQLLEIAFHGQHAAFKQQQELFQRELCSDDIMRAKQRCDARLLALTSLKAMYTDKHIKDLVLTMQAEMKASNMRLFAYIGEAEKKHKRNDTPEQEHLFGTAAEILRSIEFRATSFTGNYLVDLMTKIEQEQEPDQFIEKEKQSTTQLRDNLQAILDNEFEPARELQYDAEDDVYFDQVPERKPQH